MAQEVWWLCAACFDGREELTIAHNGSHVCSLCGGYIEYDEPCHAVHLTTADEVLALTKRRFTVQRAVWRAWRDSP